METTFTESSSNICIPTLQRQDFYEKMRNTVVVVCFVNTDGNSTANCGFIVQGGAVITAARSLGLRKKQVSNWTITVRRWSDRDSFKASVIDIDLGLNIAILAPEENVFSESHFATFGDFNDSQIGMEIHTIGHAELYEFAFVTGSLGFSGPRYVTHTPEIDYEATDPYFSKLNGDLKVIQVIDIHEGDGAWGSPLFGSDGRVLGMLSHFYNNDAFGVHVDILRSYIGDHISCFGLLLKQFTLFKRKRNTSCQCLSVRMPNDHAELGDGNDELRASTSTVRNYARSCDDKEVKNHGELDGLEEELEHFSLQDKSQHELQVSEK